LFSRSLAIFSVKEVISASVALLISPLSRFAGKAKAAVKSVALQRIDTFIFAKPMSNVKTVEEDVEMRYEDIVCDKLGYFMSPS
jgi:hypothetical protein